MTDPNQLPDEWIQVWFADQSTAIIEDSAENQTMLDAALASAGGGALDLLCLDGAPMKVRRNYVVGYVRSALATRVIERQFEKLRKQEKKGAGWDESDDD